MNERLKCGIAGFGYMGEIRKRVIEAYPILDLVGVFDPDSEKRKKVKDCPTFSTEDDFFKSEPDIIFVCTPNSFSPDITIRGLKLGKHVFCEKPPGRNIEDIKQIIKAESNRVKLMFGFNHRFHPGIIKAKVIIDSNRLGRPIALRGIYGKSGGVNFRNIRV